MGSLRSEEGVLRLIPLALIATMVLGCITALVNLRGLQTRGIIAEQRVATVRAAHANVQSDLERTLRLAGILAGYEVGWAGGEPEELELKTSKHVDNRISLGWEIPAVNINVTRENLGLKWREDGSFEVRGEFDARIEHVAGDVRARGSEATGYQPARWGLLYDVVRKEKKGVSAVAAIARAKGQNVQVALDEHEAKLDQKYASEGVVWELDWVENEVEIIARDDFAGSLVPVDNRLELMPYRLTAGEAELPKIEVEPERRPPYVPPVPQPLAPQPLPRPKPSAPEPQPSTYSLPPAPRYSEPDFTIGISPPSRSIPQGDSTSYTITLTSLDGYSGRVSLSVNGLPGNSVGVLDPNSVGLSGNSAASALTVDTTSSTPAGTYTITATGKGSKTRSASASLKVSALIEPSIQTILEPELILITYDRYDISLLPKDLFTGEYVGEGTYWVLWGQAVPAGKGGVDWFGSWFTSDIISKEEAIQVFAEYTPILRIPKPWEN